jgi:hypothetical protein
VPRIRAEADTIDPLMCSSRPRENPDGSSKDDDCAAYREMARISYAQYYEYTANPWTWLGTDLLHAASIRTTAEYWSGQAANSCW